MLKIVISGLLVFCCFAEHNCLADELRWVEKSVNLEQLNPKTIVFSTRTVWSLPLSEKNRLFRIPLASSYGDRAALYCEQVEVDGAAWLIPTGTRFTLQKIDVIGTSICFHLALNEKVYLSLQCSVANKGGGSANSRFQRPTVEDISSLFDVWEQPERRARRRYSPAGSIIVHR